MRALTPVVLALVVVVATSAAAQRRLPSTSGLINRVATETSVEPAEVEPGGTVVLRVEVKPNRNIRVFAPGANGFTPVFVVMSRAKAIKEGGKPGYDVPEFEKNPGNNKRVPLYTRTFHLTHTVTIDKDVKSGSTISVTGAITYQACDERIVYPKRTVPVHWTIRVK